MARKWIYSIVFCFITFCLISTLFSSGSKRYTFPTVPRLDDEIIDLWYELNHISPQDITFGTASYKTAQTRYYSISPADLHPRSDTSIWYINVGGDLGFQYGSTSGTIYAFSGVHLPHGAIVTSLKSYFYRDDALAVCEVDVVRWELGNGTQVNMATTDSDSTSEEHSVTDSTILFSTIDNENYGYYLAMKLTTNNAQTDAIFYGSVIIYTVTVP